VGADDSSLRDLFVSNCTTGYVFFLWNVLINSTVNFLLSGIVSYLMSELCVSLWRLVLPTLRVWPEVSGFRPLISGHLV